MVYLHRRPHQARGYQRRLVGLALCLLFCINLRVQAENVILTLLASFAGTNGANPWGPLVEGSDGKFYGTTIGGGANTNSGPSQLTGRGYGTVFSVTPEGTLTCLASFQGTNGINPTAGVAEGNDGNFYGVTWYGGVSNFGTIFQVTPTGELTTLLSFTGTNGAWPRGGLVRGPDGAFYGSTRYGGASYNDPRAINFGSTPAGRGTLFKIATNGAFSLLYSFTPDTEGFQPFNKLVCSTDGNSYGTAGGGGVNGYGILFRMTQEAAVNTLTIFSLDTGIASIALSEGRDGGLYARSGTYDASHPGAVSRIDTNGTIRQLIHLSVDASAQPPQKCWRQLTAMSTARLAQLVAQITGEFFELRRRVC